MATRIESVAVVPGTLLHHSARKLADHAVRDALTPPPIQPDDVDLLLNAGIFHDRLMGEPAMAALIQEDIGANPEDPHGEGHGTFSFDIANGSAGVLSALQVADGFLRAGTIHQAVIVAGDADPGHGLAPDFPYDPVGAALVCGWDSSEIGLVGFRWLTVADAPARRQAVVRLEHGRNQLLVREDDAFAAEAAACAGKVAAELLDDHGLKPDDIAAVAAAPFDAAFIDELVPRIGVPPDRFVQPWIRAALSHGRTDRSDERHRRPSRGPRWGMGSARGRGSRASAPAPRSCPAELASRTRVAATHRTVPGPPTAAMEAPHGCSWALRSCDQPAFRGGYRSTLQHLMGDLEDVAKWVAHHRPSIAVRRIDRRLQRWLLRRRAPGGMSCRRHRRRRRGTPGTGALGGGRHHDQGVTDADLRRTVWFDRPGWRRTRPEGNEPVRSRRDEDARRDRVIPGSRAVHRGHVRVSHRQPRR